MAFAKYRITKILIEGFRGFTNPQPIEIKQKNTFVFGVNGQGKSSIVEAIRWGIFGSVSGNDIEVRNTFYTKGECAVTLELTSATEKLEIRRELRPGQLRSRPTIRNMRGDIVLEKDVFPQLARIGHSEGTQVIFAAQQNTGRQAQVDITDLTRVLCFYMRLEKVPELLESLQNLVAERQEEYRLLTQHLEARENAIRINLEKTEALLAEILRNPPWGDGPSPDGKDTDAKITELVGDATRTMGTSVHQNENSSDALSRLNKELDSQDVQTIGTLQANLATTSTRCQRAEIALRNLTEAQKSKSLLAGDIDLLKSEFFKALDNKRLEDLISSVDRLERSQTERNVRASLVAMAKKLTVDYNLTSCPVCSAEYSQLSEPLLERINSRIESSAEADINLSELDSLKTQIKMASALNNSISEKTRSHEAANKVEKAAEEELVSILSSMVRPIDIQNAQIRIEELRRDIETLNSQILDREQSRAKWSKKIKNLEQELIFHRYRDKIQRLRNKFTDGLDGARNILRQYKDLLATISTLCEMLGQSLLQRVHDGLLPQCQRTDACRRRGGGCRGGPGSLAIWQSSAIVVPAYGGSFTASGPGTPPHACGIHVRWKLSVRLDRREAPVERDSFPEGYPPFADSNTLNNL